MVHESVLSAVCDVTVGTKVPAGVCTAFDRVAMKLKLNRGELLRLMVFAVVEHSELVPALAKELEALESQKQKRLIRYIMSTLVH